MKAHRNEEEDTTSRVVNKGSAIETEGTLEERVDRLIEGATQAPNRDSNWNHSRPPFQANQRFPRGNLNRPPRGHPQEDICQNLRGPEHNASGPFDENDWSRPIQCFKCRGWGHPKRLCPSRLNYTWGGVVQEPLSQANGGRTENTPPTCRIPNNRYENITGGQKTS